MNFIKKSLAVLAMGGALLAQPNADEQLIQDLQRINKQVADMKRKIQVDKAFLDVNKIILEDLPKSPNMFYYSSITEQDVAKLLEVARESHYAHVTHLKIRLDQLDARHKIESARIAVKIMEKLAHPIATDNFSAIERMQKVGLDLTNESERRFYTELSTHTQQLRYFVSIEYNGRNIVKQGFSHDLKSKTQQLKFETIITDNNPGLSRGFFRGYPTLADKLSAPRTIPAEASMVRRDPFTFHITSYIGPESFPLTVERFSTVGNVEKRHDADPNITKGIRENKSLILGPVEPTLSHLINQLYLRNKTDKDCMIHIGLGVEPIESSTAVRVSDTPLTFNVLISAPSGVQYNPLHLRSEEVELVYDKLHTKPTEILLNQEVNAANALIMDYRKNYSDPKFVIGSQYLQKLESPTQAHVMNINPDLDKILDTFRTLELPAGIEMARMSYGSYGIVVRRPARIPVAMIGNCDQNWFIYDSSEITHLIDGLQALQQSKPNSYKLEFSNGDSEKVEYVAPSQFIVVPQLWIDVGVNYQDQFLEFFKSMTTTAGQYNLQKRMWEPYTGDLSDMYRRTITPKEYTNIPPFVEFDGKGPVKRKPN